MDRHTRSLWMLIALLALVLLIGVAGQLLGG